VDNCSVPLHSYPQIHSRDDDGRPNQNLNITNQDSNGGKLGWSFAILH
jgi:hypothetical protein